MNASDTIAALSTAPGESALAVVRLSGPRALEIADAVFEGNMKPSQSDSHRALHGRLLDPQSGGAVDEVVLTAFRSPRSYTGEDLVEVSCHGGWAVPRQVLELLLGQGARLAEPGEFTQRAFLSGKMDLAQAEAVADLIRAKTDLARKAALAQLEGGLSREAQSLRQDILGLLAEAEAALEFPEEEGVPPPERGAWRARLEALQARITGLLGTFPEGRILREGAKVAIVGKPNVGKSSLFNALLKQDRAIVTEIPGTTRDVIEGWLSLDGLPVLLADTAGIREPGDALEQEGVRRTKNSIAEADLVLFVLDSSGEFDAQDSGIALDLGSRPVLGVLNKSDLPSRLSREEVKERTGVSSLVRSSALQGAGLEGLKAAIAGLLSGESRKGDEVLVTNLRHAQALTRTREALSRSEQALNQNLSEEFIALELREALSGLGELTGETTNEEVLSRIFSTFCIGK